MSFPRLNTLTFWIVGPRDPAPAPEILIVPAGGPRGLQPRRSALRRGLGEQPRLRRLERRHVAPVLAEQRFGRRDAPRTREPQLVAHALLGGVGTQPLDLGCQLVGTLL